MTEQSDKTCKYYYDKWCAKRDACADCPLYIEDTKSCYCMTVACAKCPYYEPAEEVNNAR